MEIILLRLLPPLKINLLYKLSSKKCMFQIFIFLQNNKEVFYSICRFGWGLGGGGKNVRSTSFLCSRSQEAYLMRWSERGTLPCAIPYTVSGLGFMVNILRDSPDITTSSLVKQSHFSLLLYPSFGTHSIKTTTIFSMFLLHMVKLSLQINCSSSV